MLIDTHAHLYLEEFDGDRKEMINRALDAGVHRFYLPNIDSSSIESMLQMEVDFPGQCLAMMGLHPCSVNENYLSELAMVEKWLAQRSFKAIGEIGIDLYWDTTFQKLQEKAFLTQLGWARELDLPIVIHSRNSIDLIIELLSQETDGKLRGVFHCFTGTAEQAARVMDLGFFMGIGGVLTFKNSGLAEVVKDIPLERLILETDSPYLAPTPYRGKRNESAYIKIIAEKLASVKNIDLEKVALQTTKNAEEIFEKKSKAEAALS